MKLLSEYILFIRHYDDILFTIFAPKGQGFCISKDNVMDYHHITWDKNLGLEQG